MSTHIGTQFSDAGHSCAVGCPDPMVWLRDVQSAPRTTPAARCAAGRLLEALRLQRESIEQGARDVAEMRRVVTDYVGHVEDGERFDALVRLVPSLVSDDGMYGEGGAYRDA